MEKEMENGMATCFMQGLVGRILPTRMLRGRSK